MTAAARAEAHVGLIDRAVRSLRRRCPHVDVDDARGAAAVALVEAARAYKDQPGGRFDWFALQRIGYRLKDAARAGELTSQRHLRRASGPGRWCYLVPLEACRCTVVDHVDRHAQRRIDLEAALRRLPPRERRLLVRILAGDTQQAIARAFGVSPWRVNQLRARAVARIREAWGVAA
jgi:RNA polymerase sigma factor (sigma-70 family)